MTGRVMAAIGVACVATVMLAEADADKGDGGILRIELGRKIPLSPFSAGTLVAKAVAYVEA